MQPSQADVLLAPAQRRHGFRFSVWDGLIIGGGGALAFWLRSIGFGLWWLVPVVLAHFFVFCNIFLVWRRWELLWAVLFIFNVAAHVASGSASGLSVLVWQTPVTLAIIALQMRSPWYHGIFARRLNPQLSACVKAKR